MAWSGAAGLSWWQRKRLAVPYTGGKSTRCFFWAHYRQKVQKDQKGVWRHEGYPLSGLSGLSGTGRWPLGGPRNPALPSKRAPRAADRWARRRRLDKGARVRVRRE